MSEVYQVTVSGIDRGYRPIAALYAAINDLGTANRGQCGPYHRKTFMEKPVLPAPPRGVEVVGWAYTPGLASGGEVFRPFAAKRV